MSTHRLRPSSIAFLAALAAVTVAAVLTVGFRPPAAAFVALACAIPALRR